MAGMHFDFTIGADGFVKGLKNIQDQLNKTAAAIEALGEREYNIETLENQVNSLRRAISYNEKAIEAYKQRLAEWDAQAREALGNQDIGLFRSIQDDIAAGIKDMEELIDETKKFKDALEQLDSPSNTTSSPMYFATEEDYQRVQQLRDEIASLKEEMATTKDDATLVDLRQSLIEAEDELRAAETAAADLAESLGGDLGRKASNTATRLYELNDAVKAQEEVVADLTKRANEACDALDALDDTASSEQVEEAQLKYSALAEELQNAENHLRNLRTTQKEAEDSYNKINEQVEALNNNNEKSGSIMEKLLGGSEKYREVVSQLPESMQKAIRGLEGMTGAAKAFIATPLGAVLAILIAAFKSVSEWMKSTEEGEEALAHTTGRLNGVLSSIHDMVVALGKAFWSLAESIGDAGRAMAEAFRNPRQAMADFGNDMKTFVIDTWKNLMISFREGGNAIAQLFNGKFSEAVESAKSSVAALATTAQRFKPKFVQDFQNAASSVNTAKRQQDSIKYEQEELAIKRRRLEVDKEIAQLEYENAQLEGKGRKRTREEQEKYVKNLERQYYLELNMANREKRHAQQSLDLSDGTNQEDRERVNKAEIAALKVQEKWEKKFSQLKTQRDAADQQAAKRAEAAAKKAEADRLKQLQAEQKLNELLDKQKREEARRAVDTELAAREAEVKAMEDGSEKVLKQLALDFDKQQVAIERAYEDLKIKKIEAARQLWNANPDNKGKAFDPTTVDSSYTEAEERAYKAQLEANMKQYADAVKENQRVDRQAMVDYLKEYGTTQEKKLAIAEEYSNKIADIEKSSDSEEVKRAKIAALQRQQESASAAVSAKDILERVDFASLFQGTALLQGVADETLREILAYIQTDDFKKMDASDQKAIYDAITSLRNDTNQGSSVFDVAKDFTTSSKELEMFTKELSDARDAQELLEQKMQEAADEAEHSTGFERDDALERVEAYRKLYDAQSEAVNNLAAKTQDAAARMASSAQTFQSKLNSVTSGISKLATGKGLSDLYSGLSDVIKGFGGNKGKDLTDATGALGKAGGYIGAAFSLADMINDQGLEKILSNVSNTITGAMTGIIKSFMGPDMWKGILTSLIDGIMAPWDALFGKQGNMEELKEDVKSLERSNEALENALNGLSDKLSEADFGDISDIGADLEAYTKKVEDNTRKMMADAVAMWERGSHSVGAKYNEYMRRSSYTAIDRINAALGTSWNSLSELVNNITTQQANLLSTKYYDVWMDFLDEIDKFSNEHNGGELLVEKLTAFTGLDGRLDDAKEKIQTAFLGVSFDGMKDNFLKTIKDMTDDGSNLIEDFNNIVYRSIADKYTDDIAEIRRRATEAAKSEQWGLLRQIEEEYKGIVKQAKAEARDAMRRGDIADSSSYTQSASSRSFSAMSQETGDELNGRFTAIQIGQEQILQQVIVGVTQIQYISDAMNMRQVAVNEIRNLVFNIDGNVDTIARQTKSMISTFGDKLERIANTLETKL